jgi:trehalose 6-phosphate phosphatase
MKWLWSEWPQVEGRIWSSGHTVLLLDYDGTLAPIARVPEEARVPAPMKSLLRRLSRSSRVTVALISGRPLANLRQLVGVRNLTYVGNHGLEMWHRGRCTSVAVPGRSREALSRIRLTLAPLVKGVPGARLEDKGLSLALHYRLARASQVACLKAGIGREVRPFVRSGALTVMNGKKVIEVRPCLNWTKGDATLRLMKRVRRRSLLPIYIGDDQTDETAFRMLRGGITIRVGMHRRSRAQYYVRGVGEVLQFLEWIRARYA